MTEKTMTAKVFIDGQAGTTGLQIVTRLAARNDVTLLQLSDHERKDTDCRREMLNTANLVILCLPDEAARQAVAMIDNTTTRVIDASTAHRTNEDWVYGMPEFEPGHSTRIAKAMRVTNPGCYANASIAILHPLVKAGILPDDLPLTINAVSGYSGGGKPMIASFEDPQSADYTTEVFRAYGLTMEHKHIPEIQRRTGLTTRPILIPSVARYRQGMLVQVPLQLDFIPGKPTVDDLHATLSNHYAGARFITIAGLDETTSMHGINPETMNETNEMRLYVFGSASGGQAVIMALLDNLGKGASGQAVQNMNLMLGFDEAKGLSMATVPDDLAEMNDQGGVAVSTGT
jgi:N-acetyl-gamma-glutamyl-phosphate reductase